MTTALYKRKGRSGKEPRHVRLYHWMTESAAWKSLSAVERAIYFELARFYMGTNNGRISFSVRQAAAAVKVSQATACRAFNTLIERGFIFPMMKGAFSLKVKHATEWRLTEHACDVTQAAATKDFMRWQPMQAQESVNFKTVSKTRQASNLHLVN